MPYVYRHFIKENTAPTGAKKIGVYKGNEKICDIPLGRLTPTTKTKLYSFGLVSDMHLYKTLTSWDGNTKFDNALTYFENEGCVFCAHCGDITQTGLYDEGDSVNLAPGQFEKYKEICDKHSIPVYGVCGNHENYVVPMRDTPTELKYYTGTDLHYSISQGDDVFIFLGQPSSGEVMSNEALQWLYETLEENRNKRCFVFVHAYIEEDSGDAMDVRENSIFEMWGSTKTNTFMNVLRHYKNVTLFHGHSHMKLQCQELDECANYTEKNGFRSVHVPSSATPRDVDTEKLESVNDNVASQGYIVDVYDDCIVLNGMDLINNVYVPLGVYKIDTTLEEIEEKTFSDSSGLITKYKNWVRYSTEADGETIYNGGLGYKNGYRVRSGGAEAEHGSASHTGFIPVKAGDIVRLSGYDIKIVETANAINVSDATFTNLGQIVSNSSYSYGVFQSSDQSWDDVIDEGNGVYYWAVPDGYNIAYIRVTGYTGADGSKMIVTVNEEIT